MMADTQPLHARLNRLFETFHIRGTPEETNADVASAMSAALERTVSAREVEALRTGTVEPDTDSDPAMLEALAKHFGVPSVYLTGSGERVDAIDANLRLIAAARDAGVNGLALRGDGLDFNDLADVFSKLAQQQHLP
ncbi:hypothetical protein OG203_11255 [Nocardia sp. NBC_01499]|uniref:hypothetical protein n=1 Tax=Nocardia sp. NBC_01499 TaxID=2903597 RepID=UPI003869FF58